MTDLPAGAVTAGRNAALAHVKDTADDISAGHHMQPGWLPQTLQLVADDALEAAAPHITAGLCAEVTRMTEARDTFSAELTRALSRNHELAALTEEVLATFHATDSGCRARVGIVQIRRWHDRLKEATQ